MSTYENSADEVIIADGKRYQAMIAGDDMALQTIFGEDLVYTHSVGKSDSKSAFIEAIRGRTFKFKSAEREALQVRYFDGSAILHGRVVLTVDVGGVEHVARNAFVTVWAKRSGSWQLVHWQSTPLK